MFPRTKEKLSLPSPGHTFAYLKLIYLVLVPRKPKKGTIRKKRAKRKPAKKNM